MRFADADAILLNPSPVPFGGPVAIRSAWNLPEGRECTDDELQAISETDEFADLIENLWKPF